MYLKYIASFFLIIVSNITYIYSQTILKITDARQLFVYKYIVEDLGEVEIKLHQPICQGRVLYFDEEWESLFSTYTSIIYDGLLYRAYYRGLPSSSNHGGIEETTCVAI